MGTQHAHVGGISSDGRVCLLANLWVCVWCVCLVVLCKWGMWSDVRAACETGHVFNGMGMLVCATVGVHTHRMEHTSCVSGSDAGLGNHIHVLFSFQRYFLG